MENSSSTPSGRIAGWGRVLLYGLISLVAVSSLNAGKTPDDKQTLKQLRALAPLPKVHYSWPVYVGLFTGDRVPLLYEYARITHAISVAAHMSPDQIDTAVVTSSSINATHPQVPVTLAYVYEPWVHVFPADAPPTDFGPDYTAELDLMRYCMSVMKQWVADANAVHGCDVRVSAVLLDCARFSVKPDDPVWNAAITRKLTEAYQLAEEVFPAARIEWFGRGSWEPYIWKPDGTEYWSLGAEYPGDEPGLYYTSILYRLPEVHNTRETQVRTVAGAKAAGITEVTPWVALGSGYRRLADGTGTFDSNYDFPAIYAWMAGAEIHGLATDLTAEEAEAFGYAKVVCFYPWPFDPGTPAWGEHFIAYVKGANGVPLSGRDRR